MNIIIPLGGKGLRFANAGYNTPKHMIRVFDKEILCYVLDSIKISLTQNDSVYIIHYYEYDLSKIQQLYPFIHLIPIHYYTRGAAETVGFGIQKILKENDKNAKKPCLLLDCDTFYTFDILSLARKYSRNAIFYFNQDPEDKNDIYSYISFIYSDKNNSTSTKLITDIIEKKRISNNANTGAYLFEITDQLVHYIDNILQNDKTFNHEYYTSRVIKEMLDDDKEFTAIQVEKQNVFFLGTPEQIKAYRNYVCAFLVDLDGTLVNTDHVYINVWNELLQDYNVNITEDVYTRHIMGNNDYMALLNIFSNGIPYAIRENINIISEKKDKLFMKHITSLEIIPNSVDFMKEIKAMGHKIVIVTNCNRKVAEEILIYIGLHTIVDHIVIGNECKKPKPFPDPYKQALELIDIPNTSAIVFEDSSSGILSAKGIFPKCIVGIYKHNTSILDTHCTDFKIKDFTEIHLSELINFERDMLKYINHLMDLNMKMLRYKSYRVDTNKLKGGFIADVLTIELVTENNDKKQYVLKLKNENDTNMTKIANNLDLYEREFYFYQNIAPYVNISIPHCLGILKDENMSSKGILLENLNTTEFTLNLDLNKESIDVSLKVIKRMVELHAKFTKQGLDTVFHQLKKNNNPMFNPSWSEYIRDRWPSFKQKWQFLINKKQMDIAELVVSKFKNIQEHLSHGILTLCHGDIKSANIFYKKLRDNEGCYEPYFIDWQYIVYGKGVQDLVFFMIESFDKDKIKDITPLFKLYYYHSFLQAKKDIVYNIQDFEKDFMVATCYFPFFVAIWFGTTDKNELIDVNFPFFFIQKYFSFLEDNVSLDLFDNL